MKVYVTSVCSDVKLQTIIQGFLARKPIRIIDIKYTCFGENGHSALIMYEEVDAA